MSKSEVLRLCAAQGGDMHKAARLYASERGIPAKAVIIGWRAILAPTRAKGAKE